MSYDVTQKAPVVLKIDGQPFPVPLASRKFFREWAAEIDAQLLADATPNMSEGERARWQAFYRIARTTTDELLGLSATPEGSERVVGHCMKEAGADDAMVERVLDELGPRGITALAAVLAHLVSPLDMEAAKETAKKEGQKLPEGSGDSNPLSDAGASVSKPSAGTKTPKKHASAASSAAPTAKP
jgi:hypothetical protein